jgi:catechol 2,3-dioxygenase-like lactoylglutathione lyase family enzyme
MTARRVRFLSLAAAVAVVLAPLAPAAAAPVRSVASVGMTVSDVDRSVEFYGKVLGFERLSDVEVWGSDVERLQGVFGARIRVARMQLGEEQIELSQYRTPRGRPIPPDARSNDRSFQHIAIIVSDMAKAYAHLRNHKVEHISTAPQRLPDWNPNAGGIQAFYFRDPDGHALEILQFPPGKGDPKWRRPSERLFLGIDHTAIVVGDTERSLAFYRDGLGLRIAGESENHGSEQEHLNLVFGARLRITSLRAASGPGIELLEYLTPRDGRPYPADSRANDLWHWQTRLRSAELRAVLERLPLGRHRFVSPGAVGLRDGRLGMRKALTLRDPDGHVLQIFERDKETP